MERCIRRGRTPNPRIGRCPNPACWRAPPTLRPGPILPQGDRPRLSTRSFGIFRGALTIAPCRRVWPHCPSLAKPNTLPRTCRILVRPCRQSTPPGKATRLPLGPSPAPMHFGARRTAWFFVPLECGGGAGVEGSPSGDNAPPSFPSAAPDCPLVSLSVRMGRHSRRLHPPADQAERRPTVLRFFTSLLVLWSNTRSLPSSCANRRRILPARGHTKPPGAWTPLVASNPPDVVQLEISTLAVARLWRLRHGGPKPAPYPSPAQGPRRFRTPRSRSARHRLIGPPLRRLNPAEPLSGPSPCPSAISASRRTRGRSSSRRPLQTVNRLSLLWPNSPISKASPIRRAAFQRFLSRAWVLRLLRGSVQPTETPRCAPRIGVPPSKRLGKCAISMARLADDGPPGQELPCCPHGRGVFNQCASAPAAGADACPITASRRACARPCGESSPPGSRHSLTAALWGGVGLARTHVAPLCRSPRYEPFRHCRERPVSGPAESCPRERPREATTRSKTDWHHASRAKPSCHRQFRLRAIVCWRWALFSCITGRSPRDRKTFASGPVGLGHCRSRLSHGTRAPTGNLFTGMSPDPAVGMLYNFL